MFFITLRRALSIVLSFIFGFFHTRSAICPYSTMTLLTLRTVISVRQASFSTVMMKKFLLMNLLSSKTGF
ncbi:MAG: hypothetical protein IIX16_09645 [Clostridia bacterium]|nr:hypothetical protein [Clostridia bacterium]